jgi:hypothetical protein
VEETCTPYALLAFMYCQFTLLSIEGQNYDSAPHGADAEVILLLAVDNTKYLTYFETRGEVEKLSLGSEVDKRCTFP